ncbi:MAG: hypothetical protein HYV27_18760 [Candidatus Hydrogenedentes bacterium]|nr:hypothetical protein [Candidatus Hydrogenedentota bacterium]
MKRWAEKIALILAVCCALAVMAAYATSLHSEGRSLAAREKLAQQLRVRVAERLQASGAQHLGPLEPPVPLSPAEESARGKVEAETLMVRMDEIESHRIGNGAGSVDINFIKELLDKPAANWTEEEVAQLRQFLAAHQGLLAELRAAAQRGIALPALDYSEGFALQLPHLQALRDMTRVLRADALLQLRDGMAEAAIDDLIAIMGIADALQDEPLLISQLVRFSQYRLAADTLRDIHNAGGAGPQFVQRILRALDAGLGREAFADSIAMEGMVGMRFFSDPDLEALGEGVNSPPYRFLLNLYTTPFASPLLDADEAVYGEILAEAASFAGLPYYEARERLRALEARLSATSRLRVFTHLLVPSLDNIFLAQARQEAVIEVARVGLAVEQYYFEHGAFPESIGGVAGYLGGALPVDPFTGAMLRYHAGGAGFHVYSVGQNMEDDGGEENSDLLQGDIVWRGGAPAQKMADWEVRNGADFLYGAGAISGNAACVVKWSF